MSAGCEREDGSILPYLLKRSGAPTVTEGADDVAGHKPLGAEDPLKSLRERRSMTRAKLEPVPRDLVQRVIEAATWAPNHRRTQPWRFVVLAGEARDTLGEVMAKALARRMAAEGAEASDERLLKERSKPLRAPVVVAVAAVASQDPKVVEIEEIVATAAAIENMLLAAQALGLGAMWRTGDAAYDPAIREFLDFPPEAHLLAFVYLGFPDIVPPLKRSGDAASITRWME